MPRFFYFFPGVHGNIRDPSSGDDSTDPSFAESSTLYVCMRMFTSVGCLARSFYLSENNHDGRARMLRNYQFLEKYMEGFSF